MEIANDINIGDTYFPENEMIINMKIWGCKGGGQSQDFFT